MYLCTIEGEGGISAKLVEYSVRNKGVPLATYELRYPRFIHSELMTHRVFSRNAASSRAIPIANQIEAVEQDPAMPIHWGKNQPGMQAEQRLSNTLDARMWWKGCSELAAEGAKAGAFYGLHKQIVNRVLEPFVFMTTVVTATEWGNFFAQRLHRDAQPEFQELARCMKAALEQSQPTSRRLHLPYVLPEERRSLALQEKFAVSVARCCRVSYGRQGEVRDLDTDLQRFASLLKSGHYSPFEHQAIAAVDKDLWSGNLRGWVQLRQVLQGKLPYYRQEMPYEHAIGGRGVRSLGFIWEKLEAMKHPAEEQP